MSLEVNIRKAAHEWAERGRLWVVNRIRDYYLAGRSLRRRSGTAARSVTSSLLQNKAGFRVGTNLGYLIAWEYGIKAHEVVAKNVQALRFRIGNRVLFRKRVFIPQQAARPSFGPALDDAAPYLHRSAQKLFHQGIIASIPNRKIIVK